MGSEDRPFQGIWICFFSESAGMKSSLHFYIYSLADFGVFCVFHSNGRMFWFCDSIYQDAQSAINDLTGKINAFSKC